MNILFWIPPWPSQADPLFFKNITKNHLARQANTLAKDGHQVDFVLPTVMSDIEASLNSEINVVELPASLEAMNIGLKSDVYSILYSDPAGELTKKISSELGPVLGSNYDAVLLWENPTPFLVDLFPEALILNQMPGAFSRAPYPATVTIDPVGLYGDSLLARDARAIQTTAATPSDRDAIRRFSSKARAVTRASEDPRVGEIIGRHAGPSERKILLPLQVSDHYAFRQDAGFHSQYDFMTAALTTSKPEDRIVATQYVQPHASERPLSTALADALLSRYPNLVYDAKFDEIESVSQHLLPHVDEVWTASSSLGLQAMAWHLPVKVFGNSFLKEFDSELDFGVEWSQRCDNALAFLLLHYQPLTSRVRTDAAFLTNLILALSEWKSGSGRAEDLPSFESISPGYTELLLSSFRDVKSTHAQSSKTSGTLRDFRRKVSMADLVSFDIFDTLVCRPFERPADLFKFMEPEVERVSEGRIRNFSRNRVTAEQVARAELHGITHDEIDINVIYSKMAEIYGFPDGDLKTIKSMETTLEERLCEPRPSGLKLFEVAKSEGKEIILTSDMYLLKPTIERILDNCGIKNYSRLYLSSNIGSRKHTGYLFDFMIESEGRQPNRILHVGDNSKGDIKNGQEKGLNVYHCPSAIDRLRHNDLYKSVYDPRKGAGTPDRSSIAGLTAKQLFDCVGGPEDLNTLFDQSPFKLGYAALGPIIVGYVHWLKYKAAERGISDLFFFSREGRILMDAYQTLFGDDASAPEAHYFLISRRCVRVAALETTADVCTRASDPYPPGVVLEDLFEGRFGVKLDGDCGTRALERIGFHHARTTLGNDAGTRYRFVELAKELSAQILQNASKEREHYTNYIDETTFLECEKPGVVDVGWNGNLQGALTELTGRHSEGFYYATTAESAFWARKGHIHHGYVGNCLNDARNPSAVIQYRDVFEYLTCHTDPTLIRFSDGASPVFHKEEGIAERRSFVRQVHSGVLAFAHDFHKGFSEFMDDFVMDPYLSEGVFKSFVSNPSRSDRNLLKGHKFENLVGGVRNKDLMKTTARTAHRNLTGLQRSGVELPSGPLAGVALTVENLFVRNVLSRPKAEKYAKDRRRFFADSRINIVRAWYALVG